MKSNDSYQEVDVQFVSEKMIFWKRTMSAVADEVGKPRKDGTPAGDGVVSKS